MALSIMNNTTALGAMTSVNKANSKLATTIKQLSTGFRINSAADDASGLAVSEKLRGQISGLSKAASNSQDAISMLQTAEAAMGTMTDIVQRMRELAVQAGDPAYTTNDRAMLQLEVDQLKQEINRVSTSTEFNTKKLLNGDAAALWSATSGDIEAIVRGTPTAGNYKIETKIAGGSNNVYKSDVMTLSEGKQSAVELKEGNAAAGGVRSVTNIQGMAETSTSAQTADAKVSKTVGLAITGGGGAVASAVATIGFFAATATVTGSGIATFVVAKNSMDNSGVFEVELLTDKAASGKTTGRIRFMNGETGALSEYVEFNIASTGKTSSALIIAGKTFAAGAISIASGAVSYAGDKILIAYTKGLTAAANATTADIRVNTGTGSGQATAAVVSTAGYSIRKLSAVDANNDTTHTIYTAQINGKTGDIYYGSMDVTLKKAAAVTTSDAPANTGAAGIALEIKGEGSVASKWTKLSEIARFVNADGRNILENTQELTIYGGNGKQATVYVEGSDTIADFEKKLTDAIVDQLGLGVENASVNDNLVNFVKTRNANSNEAVEGTFIIQTAMLGSDSALSFVGDQGLIDALSLSQIKQAQDPSMTIKVTDAHTGKYVGEDTVTDGILRGVIGGIDVKVNPRSAVDVGWNSTTKSMTFTPKAASTEYLHVADNATRAAIGANEGQTLDISIGQLDITSLELEDVNVVSFNNAQKSITKLDQALERISKARAVAGAQINRLDYTINNLNTARENLTASESRIRDLDIAEASSALAARQVLLQSATAMLAQANQLPSYAAQLLR